MISSEIKPKGDVEITIEYTDGRVEKKFIRNTVLNTGKQALVNCLGNKLGGPFLYYVDGMVFGSGGTDSGAPLYVTSSRTALFPPQIAAKPVIATVDPVVPNQINFLSVIGFSELNSMVINEMGLRMANGELYSMTTFADINKTADMQITWVWRITFV